MIRRVPLPSGRVPRAVLARCRCPRDEAAGPCLGSFLGNRSFILLPKLNLNACNLEGRTSASTRVMPLAHLLLSSVTLVAPPTPNGAAVQALRKASGALSVSVECRGAIDVPLSAALRKAGAATLWANEVDMVSQLTAEQREAQFDFPGPCPVLFHGEAAQAEAAVAAGAAAVVLEPSERALAASIGAAVIWRVSSADELQQLLDAHGDADAPALLLGSEAMQQEEALAALPDAAVVVAAVEAMTEGNAEAEEARRLAAGGACAVLLRGACVGDEEDLPYCQASRNPQHTTRPSRLAPALLLLCVPSPCLPHSIPGHLPDTRSAPT